MRARAVLVLSFLAAAPAAQAGAPATPEAVSPMRAFVGAWSGSRAGVDGTSVITRDYESAANRQQLLITERHGRRMGFWGAIRFDAERDRLVLERFSPDGRSSLLPLDPSASSETRLVFAGEDLRGRTRITYERWSEHEFVERIEQAAPGQLLTVVAETRFRRKW